MARFRLRLAREETFFELFVKVAGVLVLGAEQLLDIIGNYDDDRVAKARRLAELEHEADEFTHEIIKRLNTTFVTPMDREDIHGLASTLDDVMDHIDAAAELLVLHKIERPLPEMKSQADLIVRAARTTEQALRRLPDFHLSEYWVEINRLENEGDKLYRQSIADLFSGDYKAMDVLKWKDISDELEEALDRLEDVANMLEGIALKQA
jgi:predicted phosphate transport protein (TIGR00153 family)